MNGPGCIVKVCNVVTASLRYIAIIKQISETSPAWRANTEKVLDNFFEKLE